MDIDGTSGCCSYFVLMNDRIEDLRKFYAVLALLEEKVGGARTLTSCSGRLSWPQRGVYFFMEPGENRSDSGSGPRIVRVGTHAIRGASRTTLWKRLRQHRGGSDGGGNHRGSVFRQLVGTSLIVQRGYAYPTWDNGKSASAEIRIGEKELEREVSRALGSFPFLWLAIDDEPGAQSLRGYIERNAIALLSNYSKEPVDAPSANWLGNFCDRTRVRASGLWNSDHVDEGYDAAFLGRFAQLASATEACR